MLKQTDEKRPVVNEQSKSKIKQAGFNCKDCKINLVSKEQLDVHMKTHMESTYNCKKCTLTFATSLQLENHAKTIHCEKEVQQDKQYNCEDCPFQAENDIILKKHA